jgi:hypothetical protein
MAILTSNSLTFELTPHRSGRMSSPYHWVESFLALGIKLPGQDIEVLSRRTVDLLYADILRLIEEGRAYVELLRSLPESRPIVPVRYVPFTYVPIELNFKFTFFDGDVSAQYEGLVSVGIYINLRALDERLSGVRHSFLHRQGTLSESPGAKGGPERWIQGFSRLVTPSERVGVAETRAVVNDRLKPTLRMPPPSGTPTEAMTCKMLCHTRLSGEYVGCETSLSPDQLISFLDDLERETSLQSPISNF